MLHKVGGGGGGGREGLWGISKVNIINASLAISALFNHLVYSSLLFYMGGGGGGLWGIPPFTKLTL